MLSRLRRLTLTAVLSIAAFPQTQVQRPAPASGGPWASDRSGEVAQQPSAEETARGKQPGSTEPKSNRTYEVSQQGVTVQMTLEPASSAQKGLVEGEEFTVRFKLTDAAGLPIHSARPAAWFDLRSKGETTDARKCHEKIQSFLQASLGSRPTLDLNRYYILALNDQPNISVIDPIVGFSTSKLLAMVELQSPGAGWVLTADAETLYVSMPDSRAVAAVDTETWKVSANIEVGAGAHSVVLQPDGQYVWVALDEDSGASSGIAVLDARLRRLVTRIATGVGRHEIAFDPESRFAYVTNERAGTTSVIDIRALRKLSDVPTGRRPSSTAFSSLSRSAYVTDEEGGTILAIDNESHQVTARIAARPGLRSIRFSPDGRWGFAVNSRENVVVILDSSNQRVLENREVPETPDQVTFSKDYAYVRSLGSDQIAMIPLGVLGKGARSDLSIPGGQIQPGQARVLPAAEAVVPTPEPGSVLIANPADKIIYYYTEGMSAPMGSYQNYGRAPRSVLTIDRSLREKEPGIYVGRVRPPAGGNYDAAFLLDSPRVAHCFDVAVEANPALKRQSVVAVHVEPLLEKREMRPGQPFHLRFRVTDSTTGKPRPGIDDLGVLVFSPSIWQARQWATSAGQGNYEVVFTPPEPGAYYFFWECPSLGLRYGQIPPFSLMAVDTQTGVAADPARTSSGLVTKRQESQPK